MGQSLEKLKFMKILRNTLLPVLIFSALGTAAVAEYAPVNSKPPEPTREFRAAWVATVHNIDWPSRPGLSAGQQRSEMISILDTSARNGLNAIVLQVRTECDALYKSNTEPWSYWLTGQMGRAPSDGYDPLEFAISEAHKRGLELHAWFNPFRASASDKSSKSSRHISRTHSSLMLRAGTQTWANPSSDYVRERAISVMLDVTKRYNVDGIHIDDYFYPYPKKVNGRMVDQFDDSSSYKKYKMRGGRLSQRDWRRNHMDTFVSSLYKSVKSAKPWVKVGVSPFGIWRPGVPASIEADLDAYDHISADSRKWLNNGWIDYFSPQLYWRIDDKPHSFTTLIRWWAGENKQGRHLWPGIASSRINSSADPGRPASEITRQIDATRKYAPNRTGTGHVHWSFEAIKKNKGGLASKLGSTYASAAIPPASPWLGSKAPTPSYTAPVMVEGGVSLQFQAADDIRWRIVQSRDSKSGSWKTHRMIPGGQSSYKISGTPAEIAIRSVSNSGIASAPTVLGKR